MMLEKGIRNRIKGASSLVLIMMLLPMLLLLPTGVGAAPTGWAIETIDSTGDVGLYTSMALDSDGYAHISYYDETNGNLKYATNVGGSWQTYTLDSTGTVGSYTSIAIDLNDKVHISYYDETNTNLKYATNAGGSWTYQTIDGLTGNVGKYSSIAIDSVNRVHMSYYDADYQDLKYAHYTGAPWTIERVDSGPNNTGIESSLAIDSTDHIHIVFHNSTGDTTGDLMYANNVGGTWTVTNITKTLTTDGGRYPDIALDSLDKLHISWNCGSCGDLRYTDSSLIGKLTPWTTVDGAYSSVGRYTSIDLDSNDKSYISYYNYTGTSLMYATNAGGTWVKTVVDSAGTVGLWTSITVNASKYVAISYYDESNGDLRYAGQADRPAAPNLISAAPGNAQVTLSWTQPDNGGSSITGYKVYRGTTSGSLTLRATLGNVLTYNDIALTNGQTYYYKVSAINALGEGAQSNELSAIPAIPILAPGVPRSLAAVGGDGQIQLTWSTPSSDGGAAITGYNIYRGTTSGSEAFLTDVGTILSYLDDELTNGQIYYYKVAAVNSVGEGAKAAAYATPNGVPTAPTNLNAVTGDAVVDLSWTAPSYAGPGTLTYHLFRDGAMIWSGTSSSYSDDVMNGVTYSYTVAAQNSLGWGPNCTAVEALTEGSPSVPNGLTADSGNGYVSLNWTAPSYTGSGTVTYHLFRNGMEVYTGVELSFNDTGLTNEVTYVYKISASNSLGWGANSTTINARPSAVAVVPPEEPTDVDSDVGNGTITLSWEAPSETGSSEIVGYNIYRGTASGSLSLLTTVTNGTTFTDTGLTNGQTYYYQVSAVNEDGGESTLTDEIVVIPSAEEVDEGGDMTVILLAMIMVVIVGAIWGAIWTLRKKK